MANLNKVMLMGRLGGDPEPIVFDGRTAGCKFRFAVNDRKKNKQTGEWENSAVWVDVEAWNRGEDGKTADLILNSLRKGSHIFVEGSLKLDEWEDKNGGGKRSKLKVTVQIFQYLDKKEDGDDNGGGHQRPASGRGTYQPRQAPQSQARPGGSYDDDYQTEYGRNTGNPEDDIPF